MATGGITNKIQVLEEASFGDGGVTGEKVFGVTKRFEWREETSTVQSYALESGSANPSFNIDGVLVVTGTHEFEFTDGRAFKAILGAQSGTTSFTLTTANTLPSYSVKAVHGDGFVIIKGLKYNKFNISVARGETVVVSAEWTAKVVEETTTFTPTLATIEPLVYLDGRYTLGSTAQTEIDSISIDITRAQSPRRFIESVSAGDRRLITQIIDGVQTVTFSGVQAAKLDILREINGAATVQDTRTNKDIVLTLSRGTSSLILTISGSRYTSTGRSFQKDDEVAVQEFAGVGLTVVGTGTYS